MPSQKNPPGWKAKHAVLMHKGFCKLGWDPLEIKGKNILPFIVKAIEDHEEFKPLERFLLTSMGGVKKSNNKIYGHYKTEASEYTTDMARRGVVIHPAEKKSMLFTYFTFILQLTNILLSFFRKLFEQS
jgi:hypothetical protein